MTSFGDAFRGDIEPATGGWRDQSEPVKRKVSALVRGSRFWIGIASNGEKGVESRWNQKYKGVGMQSIAIVYQTSSDSFRKAIEKELIDFYEDRCDNKIGGGGGGSGTGPYVVYVAWG